MYKIKRYFQGVIKQAKMVRWPTRRDMLSAFAVVLVIIAISAIALTIDDYIIAQFLNVLDSQFGTEEATSSAAAAIILGFLK